MYQYVKNYKTVKMLQFLDEKVQKYRIIVIFCAKEHERAKGRKGRKGEKSV
jgi:hypothetical protein